MNRDETAILGGWSRTYFGALIVAGVVAVLVPYLLAGQKQFFQSYLFGWLFWLCVSLGCFGFTLLHHVLRGSWGLPLLRLFEAGNRTLPLMFLLFLPILLGGHHFGMHDLYEWMHADVVRGDAILRQKVPYLNYPFFAVRFVLYFAIWIGISMALNRWSLEQDRTGDRTLADKRTNLSAPGLVLFFITCTFAFTDWVMSLEPHWFSTIYGIWFVVGQGLTTMAMVTAFVTHFADRRPYAGLVTPRLLRDWGNLMLTLTMLWAYTSLSQFLIIWAANLPEEVTYYIRRFEGSGKYVGAFTILCQFFLPFLLLLSGRTKRTPSYLLFVAVWILFLRIVDFGWIIIPAFDRPEGARLWADLIAFVGIGAFWISAFVYLLGKQTLLPTHDPRLHQETLEHA